MEIILKMDDQDFEKLTDNSGRWGEWARRQDYRWERTTGNPDDEPSWDWAYAYWVGDDWSKVMLCRAFLDSVGLGHPCEILWDMAEHPNGDVYGFVILTNYAAPVWQRYETLLKETNSA